MALHTLLVGIDDHPPCVRKLQGCVDDARRMEHFLAARGDGAQGTTLVEADAAREKVIAGFQQRWSWCAKR